MNRDAFLWGRRAAVDPRALESLLAARKLGQRARLAPAPMENLDEAIAWRRKFLVAYQDEPYAQRYVSLVERVRAVEAKLFPGKTQLTRAVATYYFKLLAIKDEYEVARLHVDSGFLQKVQEQFEGGYKLTFHLAPPFMASRNSATGEPRKTEFGSWVIPLFRILAKLRFVRGTLLDVFGRTAERRMDRELLSQYQDRIAQLLVTMEATRDPSQYDTAVAIASLPEQIRGYGHVRERHVQASRLREAELLDALKRRVIPLRKAA